MRNIFDVYIFPFKMNTSWDIRQKLERSRILGVLTPLEEKAPVRSLWTSSMFIMVLFLTTLWKKKIFTNYVQEGFFFF